MCVNDMNRKSNKQTKMCFFFRMLSKYRMHDDDSNNVAHDNVNDDDDVDDVVDNYDDFVRVFILLFTFIRPTTYC